MHEALGDLCHALLAQEGGGSLQKVASSLLGDPVALFVQLGKLDKQGFAGAYPEPAAEVHCRGGGRPVQRMQDLINDLLEYSRVGTRGNPFVEVDFGDLLRRVVINLTPRMEECGAVVEAGPLPTVRADLSQMEQLLQNLVGNAIKYRGEAAPLVTVAASEEPAAWHFTISDNGIGIDPAYADRIFVIFQRLHGKEEYEGTGIGLSICKKIIERHAGHIWVESQPGQGSTFHFTLPKEEATK